MVGSSVVSSSFSHRHAPDRTMRGGTSTSAQARSLGNSAVHSARRGGSARALDVRCMAITRKTKEAAVSRVQQLKETNAMAFAFNYETMTVSEMESFRNALPEEATCVIMKNRLMKISLSDDDNWSPLCEGNEKGRVTGMNAFVFSPVESIKPTVKAYLKTAKDLKKKDVPPSITGGVFDGQYLTGKDVEALENMPTKEELYAKIAGLIKQVPTKVAMGVKQVPTKVGYGVRAIADKKEDAGEE